MSNFVWCHGPSCHKSHTQDRIRGVKGSKVLRTKKVSRSSSWNIEDRTNMYSYFCSQGCYNDFANTYVEQVIAIAPRTEALETPVNVTREKMDSRYGDYMETRITTVDNNGG
jgi:YHS domain-containing protein